FDLTRLPSGVTGADVTRAILRIWVNRVERPGLFHVRPVLAAWTEESLNGVNAPALGPAIGPAVLVPIPARRSFLAIDVSDLVRSWVDDKHFSRQGIALVAQDSLSA